MINRCTILPASVSYKLQEANNMSCHWKGGSGPQAQSQCSHPNCSTRTPEIHLFGKVACSLTRSTALRKNLTYIRTRSQTCITGCFRQSCFSRVQTLSYTLPETAGLQRRTSSFTSPGVAIARSFTFCSTSRDCHSGGKGSSIIPHTSCNKLCRSMGRIFCKLSWSCSALSTRSILAFKHTLRDVWVAGKAPHTRPAWYSGRFCDTPARLFHSSKMTRYFSAWSSSSFRSFFDFLPPVLAALGALLAAG